MTISTPPADRPAAAPQAAFSRLLRHPRRGRAAAFTLTEVIVASAISAFILAGVLSTFLVLGRTGLNSSAYAGMSSELRVAIECFNRDARLATDLRWHDARSLTLVLPADVGPSVTYAFEPASDPAAAGRFIRQADGAPAETLVAHVAPDFSFARYRLPDSDQDVPAAATNDLETKQLEVRLRALRPGAQAPSASQLATSARCVLRNKSVSR